MHKYCRLIKKRKKGKAMYNEKTMFLQENRTVKKNKIFSCDEK